MNELLKVEINANNEQVINGRMLYEFLQIKTPYTMWINRMISYGFIENIDKHNVKRDLSILTEAAALTPQDVLDSCAFREELKCFNPRTIILII